MDYFNELFEINRIITNDDNNVRIENLEEVYQLLDTFNKKAFNLDEFIKLCILLFNMQIFYDGNSRTILAYLVKVIDKNGYAIDIEAATKGLIKLKGLFPSMYDLNEELDYHEIEKIKENISKKKVKVRDNE